MSDVTPERRSLCVCVCFGRWGGRGSDRGRAGLLQSRSHGLVRSWSPGQSGHVWSWSSPSHLVLVTWSTVFLSSTAAAAALLLIVVRSWCVQGLRVDVSPRAPLLRLGQRHQLVCQVQGCTSSPVLSWSLLEDRPLTARVATNGTHSLLTFDPVLLEDEGALVCRASCGGDSRQSKVLVQVYCE